MATSPSANLYTGPKRPNPFDEESPAKRKRQEPVDMLKGWLSALEKSPLPERARVEDFLGYVALGIEFPYHPNDEQPVYNDLIQVEAYDCLREVFAAFNQIAWPNTHEDARPDPFKLVLQLPHDWAPRSPLRMIEAFKQLPAQRVVIFPQPSDAESYYWVCDGAHDCLLAMLESGTGSLVELAIHGTMEDPHGVADAFEDSKLQSIEFGWMDEKNPPDDEDMESYRILAQGLASCSTLTHIDIAHPAFFSLHTVIKDFPSNGPKLSSVSFDLALHQPVKASPWDRNMQVRDFIEAVGDFPTLSTVVGNACIADGESLRANFIEPLTGHEGLTRLEIVGGLSLPTDAMTLNVLPMVAALGTSCACFTHFGWVEDDLALEAGDNMRAFIRAGGDLDMAAPCANLAASMTASTFLLQSLTFNGQPLASGVLNTFFALLKHNTTLWYLNLDRCHTDLRSALILMDVLKTNTALKTVILSTHYDDYYFVASDSNVYGFLQNDLESDHDADDDDPEGFTLTFGEGVTDAERALALKEFAELESEANQLFDTLRAHNLRGQREMATASATPAQHVAADRRADRLNAEQNAAKNSTTTTTTTTTTTRGTPSAEPMFMRGVDLSPHVPEPEDMSTGTPGLGAFPLLTPESSSDPNSPKG